MSSREDMTFTITFGEPENVTNPGQDGIQYCFPFAVVDSALWGTPEQVFQTQNLRIIVPISRSRLAGWRLSEDGIVKVLFEYGKRHLAALIKSNAFPSEYTIRYPTISTVSHPGSVCPFDSRVIETPAGFTMDVEVAKPRIGF